MRNFSGWYMPVIMEYRKNPKFPWNDSFKIQNNKNIMQELKH
jgi:hypothetical protein